MTWTLILPIFQGRHIPESLLHPFVPTVASSLRKPKSSLPVRTTASDPHGQWTTVRLNWLYAMFTTLVSERNTIWDVRKLTGEGKYPRFKNINRISNSELSKTKVFSQNDKRKLIEIWAWKIIS